MFQRFKSLSDIEWHHIHSAIEFCINNVRIQESKKFLQEGLDILVQARTNLKTGLHVRDKDLLFNAFVAHTDEYSEYAYMYDVVSALSILTEELLENVQNSNGQELSQYVCLIPYSDKY